MSPIVTLLADLLVAVLLVATISTSVVLSRRITRLKADESAMRRTTGELLRATETAERAIAGLRSTLGECDRTLAERLRVAERYAADLAAQVEAGSGILTRIAKVVESTRKLSALHDGPAAQAEKWVAPHGESLKAAASAAEALTARAKRRLQERAA